MDTFQHAVSIIEKGTAKNLAFLQKEIDTRNRTGSGQLPSEGKPQGQELTANSVNDDEAYHRTDHRRHTRKPSRPRCWDRPVPFKRLALCRQCSQHSQRRETRSREDYSDVQGQTRQHSKLINRLEVERI